jgi:cell division protein FtsL
VEIPGGLREKVTTVTIAFIVTLVCLALVAGYAARQMQDIQEKDTTIAEQKAEIEGMRGKPSVIEEQDAVIEALSREVDDLTAENRTLRQAAQDHESNLEMVLDEMDKTDKPE